MINRYIKTPEQIKEFYNYYLETKSIVAVSKKYHSCTKSLRKWFRESNFKFPLDNFNRKYTLNDKYFDIIDTELKAYLLGFFFADGGIYVRNRGKNGIEKVFQVRVSIIDSWIIGLFKKELNYSGKLIYTKSINFISPINKKTYTRKPQTSLCISSNSLCNSLEKYGLGNRKTYSCLTIPEIDNSLLPHFIRGLWDGDGCFSKSKNCKYSGSITSKNICILESLKEILQINGVRSSITIGKTRNVYILRISTVFPNMLKFYNLLYTNYNFFFSRKQIKIYDALLKSGELLGNPEVDNQQPS